MYSGVNILLEEAALFRQKSKIQLSSLFYRWALCQMA
jgi:hypothetical protein